MTRFKETLKDIVIVLLLLLSLFLVVLALPASIVTQLPLSDRLAAFLGVERAPAVTLVQSSKLTPAASPLTISIRHDGGRHTIRRDTAALDAAYDRLSVYLGRCLSAAREGQALTPDEVTDALERPGVLFTYPGAVPAQALCRWLTDTDGEVADICRDYLLQVSGKNILLITCGDSPKQYDTSVSAAGLLNALETYTPDGTDFAAGKDSRLHPMTLWEPSVSLPSYTAENPVDSTFAKALATALDFNPYGAGTYTDPEGNTVFSETRYSLSVAADGAITLTVTEPGLSRFTAESDTPTAKIETARQLLETIIQDSLGDAELLLAGYEEGAVRFTYVLGGVAVSPAACTVLYDGVNLTEASLTLRSYHLTLGQNQLMPLSSAAAIADPGTRLHAAYTLSAVPGWTKE